MTTQATPVVDPDSEPLVAEAFRRHDPRWHARKIFFLPVTLQGRSVSLILDTGTGFNLYLTTAALAELPVSIPASQVMDSLTVGKITERDIPVVVGQFPLDTMNTPPGIPPLIGILGNFWLPHYDLVFDGPDSLVQLYRIPPGSTTPFNRRAWLPRGLQPSDCTPFVPVDTTDDHSIYMPVVVNGQSVQSWFDSGSWDTQMSVAAAQLFGITPSTSGLTAARGGGYIIHNFPITIGARRVIVPTLHIRGSFDPADPMALENPFIQFGSDAFRDDLLLISYSTRQICLGAVPGHGRAVGAR